MKGDTHMVTIFIDNRPVQVMADTNLLHACIAAGIDIPYFCWHPAFGSVGACRQCAVKQFQNEADTKGKLVMACMTPVKDGLRFSIGDADAQAFRAAVIEWMMTNHPHDCPVCDEGGECHLQDMTVASGHNYRRFRFTKRTFHNQDLGPFIHHEMNRCIQCYRCERYYRDVAGGRDFSSQSSRNHVYFGRAEPGRLESEFSGNLVEVCPTGVFTDKTFRKRYTRKWDLSATPSICPHCGVGCNITLGERYGTVRRTINRFHPEINGYFLCDRGRFGYEYLHAGQNRKNADEGNVGADLIRNCDIGIGSPRASLETNYAIWKRVGASRFYAGMTGREYDTAGEILSMLKRHASRIASVHDVEHADAVCIFGEDVIQTAPSLGLAIHRSLDNVPAKAAAALGIPDWHAAAVRTVIQNDRGPLAIVSSVPTTLGSEASHVQTADPARIARIAYAVTRLIDPNAPPVADLDSESTRTAEAISRMLLNAEMPVVVTGMSALEPGILQAVSNIMIALETCGKSARLALVVPDWNTIGLMMLDPKPLFEGKNRVLPDVRAALVVETDLFRIAGAAEAERWFAATPETVVLDCIDTRSTEKAKRFVRVASPAASAGTVVNSEGRAQRFFPATPPGEVLPAWKWLGTGGMESPTLDRIIAELTADFPGLKRVRDAAPGVMDTKERFPRQTHRFSGRTSMTANRDVHEPGVPPDPDAPLAFSMEGSNVSGALTTFVWTPGLNSGQAGYKQYLAMQASLTEHTGSGVRLVEGTDRKSPYFSDIPPDTAERGESLRLIPLYLIFGSEPLSVRGEAIGSLVPEPYIMVNPDDATTWKLEEGAGSIVRCGACEVRCTVRISDRIARGVAAFPVGIPGCEGLAFGEGVELRKGAGA